MSIIVVTYNSAELLETCLRPFAERVEVQIVVIDNASSDNSVASAREISSAAIVIDSGANLGFAKAVNQAAQFATGEYLLMLNPDANLRFDDLMKLIAVADEEPRYGVLGPIVASPDNSIKTLQAGRFPSLPRILLHSTGLAGIVGAVEVFQGHYLYKKHVSDRVGVVDIDWVTGGCMLVRRTAWDRLGGLTERWFMYAEDIEFCYRAKSERYGVGLVPSLSVDHSIGGSSGNFDGKANTIWLSNLFDFYRSSMSQSKLAHTAWRWSMALGFAWRAAVLTLYDESAHLIFRHEKAGVYSDRIRYFKQYYSASLRVGRDQDEQESRIR